jgi:Holliday junction resolvase
LSVALERDLVDDCREAAKAMGAFLAEVGQRRAKGSGTTKGYPDLTLLCAGHVLLIELKRAKTRDHQAGRLTVGQVAFIERAAEQGVPVYVLDTLEDFVALVNACRRRPR